MIVRQRDRGTTATLVRIPLLRRKGVRLASVTFKGIKSLFKFTEWKRRQEYILLKKRTGNTNATVFWTLACRVWTLTTPPESGRAERFDKGMESTLRAEFWTGTAPTTRKGSAVRTKAEEKYI